MSSEQKSDSIKTKKLRVELKHALPDKLSFERLGELLKAYVVASQKGKIPVSYKEVGKLSVSPANVSKNNKFFEETGFIQKVEGERGKYIPTLNAIDIIENLNWDKEEEAKKILRNLLMKTWFWSLVNNLLLVQNHRSEDEIIKNLGQEVGADPKKHIAALKILVEYLYYSELLKQDNGMYMINEIPMEREINIKKTSTQDKVETQQNQSYKFSKSTQILIGVLITPDMPEDQIRNTIRIIKEEAEKIVDKRE
jgi:hypothetical protein